MARGFQWALPSPSTRCSTRRLVASCPSLQVRTWSPVSCSLPAVLRFTLYRVGEVELKFGSTDHWCDSGSEDSLSKAKYKQTPLTILPLKSGETDLEQGKECLQSRRARRWWGRGSSPDPPVPQTHSVVGFKHLGLRVSRWNTRIITLPCGPWGRRTERGEVLCTEQATRTQALTFMEGH